MPLRRTPGASKQEAYTANHLQGVSARSNVEMTITNARYTPSKGWWAV